MNKAGYLTIRVDATADLESFAARHRVGIAAVLRAALGTLLAWYSESWDPTLDQSFLALVGYSAKSDRAEPEFSLGLDDGHLAIHLRHDGLPFGPGYFQRFAEHFRLLLRQAVRYPLTEVGAFEPLTGEERRQQLSDWNATAAAHEDTTIHALIDRRARIQPDAVALTDPRGGRRTYGSLVARARSIARCLIGTGVRPGDFVALLVGRGMGRVEAMLGVLFAGAAYVPIEPAAPPGRLAFMLADSGTRWAITDEQSADRGVLSGAGVHVMTLGRLAGADAGQARLPAVEPGQPAYCMYTSGTTGRPKGIVITHRNVVRLLDNDRFPFSLGPRDVWTMFHSYAFDISVWEVYCCLARGGRLVVIGADEASDMQRYWQLVRREQVTVIELTPSAFGPFSQIACADPGPSDVRYLFIGGEKLRPRIAQEWMRRWPAVTVVNAYGPTEVTVRATARILTSDDVDADVSNIGRPIPTTTVYLLDQRTGGRLLPAGAVGEIHVGGLGVASGYLGRPDLSAEWFTPNPFGDGLLFRTGDLGRYRPDGTVEYIGRRDKQVKLRGFRVEPDEVASCLREHPSVADAVVLVGVGASDSLAACLRWRGDGVSAADLRAHLSRLLPPYMVPARFYVAGRFPLTQNGKLDEHALLASAAELADPSTDGRPPGTPTAAALAEICSELLGRNVADAGRSFFELGGDSLLAMRLVSQVADKLGGVLEVRDVFEHPVLADLADHIDAAPRRHPRAAKALLAPGSVLRAPSSIQERIWFAERMEPVRPVYNVPLAWEVRGHLDTDALRDALRMVIARHEILRTRFTERGGRLRQVVDPPWVPDIELADLRGTPEAGWRQAVALRLRREAGKAFDLESDRLLRFALLTGSGARQALIVSTHHLVWDEASAAIFVRELELCYGASARHGDDNLPAATQYRVFVDWQRRQSADAAGLEYWYKRLLGAPGYLPIGRPVPPEEHGTVRFALSPGMPQRFRRLRTEHRVSPFMVIAAAVAGLLHSWTGLPDVTFGCPVANRVSEETAEVLGPCLNLVVLRSRCEPGATLADVLAAMREEILGMLSHQSVPFEAIVSRLSPARRAGWTPYVDVAVNLPGGQPAEATLGGATLVPAPFDQWDEEIKFSLSVIFLTGDDEYRGVVSYRGDRLRRVDAERFARGLERSLDHFAELLGEPLSKLKDWKQT